MFKEFSRQPRFLPELPSGSIEIPNPPSAYDKPEISWFSILVPPTVMLIITILIAMSAKSMFLLMSVAMTVMALTTSLINASSQIKKFKKKKKERETKYLQFVSDTRSGLEIAHEQQAKAMNEMNPDPAECLNRIKRIDSKLWERTPSHSDFLSLRIGVGNAPLMTEINYTKQAIIMETDPLLMEPQRIADEFSQVKEVPIAINLIKNGLSGIAGDSEATSKMIELMLLQLITHHVYDDVKIVVVTSMDRLSQWEWIKQAPHIWDEGFNNRFLLCGKEMVHQTLAELYAVFKERELKVKEGIVLPHFVFIVEDTVLLDNEPINKYLFHDSTHLGASVVFVAQHQAYLPMNCQTVVTYQGKSATMNNRISGEKVYFTPDTLHRNDLNIPVRQLTALRVKNASADFNLPKSVTLLNLFKIEKIEAIACVSRWHKNRTYMGMSVPIGAKAGGADFNLDMHETGHGPHGLVAGTTGSGKSELLQSIIISLAIHYHPHDIVFVLIDYKGGGMADVFKGLPHLVGTITNLGGNQTTRALLSIKSELKRRQRLFSEFGVNNIDKYQKAYHSDQRPETMPAIPHLIIIADEFAELKQDQPEFMQELVSAARVGRSLGVHLILATQKPAGVVDDQIWSNSKFKICLKVQDEADSRDVLKKTDAAYIKEPGRAYIQVGNDEIYELFQSAFSGADYDPDHEMKKSENRLKRIYNVALNGRSEQIYPLEEEKIAKKEMPTQLKATVEYLSASAEVAGIKPLDGPWLAPLPELLYLEEKPTFQKNKEPFKVTIGLMDDPRAQTQEPLAINFAEDGNLLIYGASGTGKTNLIKTICLSAAQTYTAREVYFYLMDFGGTSLKAMEALPHCGGVMTLDQERTISQFTLYLHRLIEERKKSFEKSGYDSFIAYKENDLEMPAILVIIDNYFALSETYEYIDEQINLISREGNKYGVFLVVTAMNSALIRYRFSVNFKSAVCYQLIEKSEYDTVLGRTEGLEPTKIAGRGLIRHMPPLEFHTALPQFEGRTMETTMSIIREKEKFTAVQIPVMPATVLIERYNDNENTDFKMGLSENNLEPVSLDLSTIPVLVLAGEPMSGKSALLTAWIKTLVTMDISVIDSQSMGLSHVLNMPHVREVVENDSTWVEEMTNLIETRRAQLIETKKSNESVKEIMQTWRHQLIVVDRFNELTSGDQYRIKDLIERIIRKERNLKITVMVSDNLSEFMTNWDSLCKIIKDEQVGILLGSLKEQGLFNARIPYGTPEKEIQFGDGYFINRTKNISMRFAFNEEIE